jgi:hypothetical protein
MSDTGLLDAILGHLQVTRGPYGRGEHVEWCPFHPDGPGEPPHRPNLHVSARSFYCHACHEKGALRKLAEKLGVDVGGGNGRDTPHRICATYPYRDDKGNLLFEVAARSQRDSTSGGRTVKADGLPISTGPAECCTDCRSC